MKRQCIAILVIISITSALVVAGCSSKEDSGSESGSGSTSEYTTSMVDMLKFDSGEYDSGVFVEHY